MQRDYKSFNWLSFPSFLLQIGFGWSTDWLTRVPWSLDGKNLPYVGCTPYSQKGALVDVYYVTIGPVIIIIAHKKETKCT